VQTFANAAARTAAIPTPTEGIVSYLNDTNALELYNNGWNIINPSSGNAIINGAFDIWQRGTSFSSASLFQYTADRWLGNSFAGVTATVSRQSFSPGTAPAPGYEGEFFLRFNRGAGTIVGSSFLTQRIEDVRTFAGQTVTLSFFAKAATAGTIAITFDQLFGSGGSSGAGGIGQNASITTSWNRFILTFTIPSIVGKTVGSGSYLDLVFNMPALFGNNTLDIWGVQLEAGNVATPFRRNAPSLQAELAACQRYYEAGSHPFEYRSVTINAFVTVSHRVTFFKVTKRVSPSVTVTRGASDNAVAGNGTLGGVTNDNFVHTIGINDTNFPYVGLAYSWTAAAEL
jgi:hypothetical protein